MLFNSLTFLFWFLPACIGVYYIVPDRFKNFVLIAFSFVFYAFGGVSYSVILIGSVCFNHLFASQIQKQKSSKTWLYIGLLFNVILLLIFKYLNFFLENSNVLLGLIIKDFEPLEELKILLPLGISFFTFQQMSMLWDLYKAKESTPVKFDETALYVGLFPQLIAGPIVRYHDIIASIRQRTHRLELIESGIFKFILGLFKKVIIANSCAAIADEIFVLEIAQFNTNAAWLAIVCYSFQIYFDFSGYSDMAIGLGRIFGFNIAENFMFPYTATSIKSFWRKWHISLSTWFRDYVYIPLGGSKLGSLKMYRNLLIVFLLTGFWHGATWSFVFWGAFHGSFLLLERLGLSKILDKTPRPISWAYTMLVVIIGWVFFRIEDFESAWLFTLKLFDFTGSQGKHAFAFLNQEKIALLILAVLSSSMLIKQINDKLQEFLSRIPWLQRSINTIAAISVFVYCVLHINADSYSPFIYFRF
jgi:alginate O-acetyltransferase complex protein AlgI